jgi:hypothetical protein
MKALAEDKMAKKKPEVTQVDPRIEPPSESDEEDPDDGVPPPMTSLTTAGIDLDEVPAGDPVSSMMSALTPPPAEVKQTAGMEIVVNVEKVQGEDTVVIKLEDIHTDVGVVKQLFSVKAVR